MMHILLIEDNISIRENTQELLELAGYEVTAVDDGTEGVRVALDPNFSFDLIISDIKMKEMDGNEVLDILKSESKTSSIPFVFMTASVEPSEIKAAYKDGVDAYLKKPFDQEELLDVVTSCIDSK